MVDGGCMLLPKHLLVTRGGGEMWEVRGRWYVGGSGGVFFFFNE